MLCYLCITYPTSNILHYVLWSQPIVVLLDTIISLESTMFELVSTTLDMSCVIYLSGGPMKATISGLNRNLRVCKKFLFFHYFCIAPVHLQTE